jgi:hypothetical protein
MAAACKARDIQNMVLYEGVIQMIKTVTKLKEKTSTTQEKNNLQYKIWQPTPNAVFIIFHLYALYLKQAIKISSANILLLFLFFFPLCGSAL